MARILDGQNIMDATLQAYGTLDECVRFAVENDTLLDELPTIGQEYFRTEGIGDEAVLEFVVDRQFIYNNGGVEASELILANTSEEHLIAKIDIRFKYK